MSIWFYICIAVYIMAGLALAHVWNRTKEVHGVKIKKVTIPELIILIIIWPLILLT